MNERQRNKEREKRWGEKDDDDAVFYEFCVTEKEKEKKRER